MSKDSTVLQILSLSKQFKNFQAVKSISLEIQKGQVYGLLGPNGSGKTTTLAMLLGVLKPTEGSFSWFNNGNAATNRKRIGSLLETPNFYPYLNAYDNLKIVATIKEVSDVSTRIKTVLERVDLVERGLRPFKTYSLGMKQRLAVASALLSDPEVLVLDEPTNGLDPMGIADMRELILSIANEGKTIIFASHILDEVEKICTHVGIMRNGELLTQGSMQDILKQKQYFQIKAEDMDLLRKELSNSSSYQLLQSDQTEYVLVESMERADGAALNKLLVSKGIFASEIRVYKKSLETIFIETVQA